MANKDTIALCKLRRSAWAGGILVYVTVLSLMGASTFAQNSGRILSPDQDSLHSMSISSDGRVATGGDFPGVKVWDIGSGQLKVRSKSSVFSGLTGVRTLAFSPDGRYLVAGGQDIYSKGQIALFDAASLDEGTRRLLVEGHPSEINEVTFDPTGRFVAAVSNEVWQLRPQRRLEASSTLILIDVQSAKMLWQYTQPEGNIASVAFSPDGSVLFAGGNSPSCGQIRSFQVATGKIQEQFPCFGEEVRSIAVSPKGSLMVAGGTAGAVLYEIGNPKSKKRLEIVGHNTQLFGRIWSVALSPDGRLFATGGLDGDVKIWDAEKGTGVQTLSGHSNYIQQIIFSKDGRLLISLSADNTLRFWNLPQ